MTNLRVFQKTYDLFVYCYPILKKFPQSERFTLVQKIENAILDILTSIVQAVESDKRLDSLKFASMQLEKLKVLLRLSKELQFISVNEYEGVSSYTVEIGKMIGSWIKTESSQLNH